ncbi:MAG: V-type ATP synthase subunit E family protein [Desulfobacterales bacterium]|jgi:vacuolar-type H+-ATPase subunit E/Vma4|nr:V-type ATP synthase subunit E family protein [Desulfobacterales bacterium]
MPIWGQVELLCRSITEEGRKQSEKLLEQARLQADNTLRDAALHADRQYQEARLSGKSRAVAEAASLVDTAELAARRRVMIFHRQMLQEVMDALTERLKQFRNQPAYESFLISAAREAIEHLPGREVIIEAAEPDAEVIRRRLDELAHACSAAITIRDSNAVNGGVRVFTADQKVMFDNSLDARLNRVKDEIRQEIWRTIVGTQIRQD